MRRPIIHGNETLLYAEPRLWWVRRGWMATRTKYIHPEISSTLPVSRQLAAVRSQGEPFRLERCVNGDQGRSVGARLLRKVPVVEQGQCFRFPERTSHRRVQSWLRPVLAERSWCTREPQMAAECRVVFRHSPRAQRPDSPELVPAHPIPFLPRSGPRENPEMKPGSSRRPVSATLQAIPFYVSSSFLPHVQSKALAPEVKLPEHCRKEPCTDLVSPVLNRREEFSVIRSAMASFACPGFKSYRNLTLSANAPNAAYEFVTLHQLFALETSAFRPGRKVRFLACCLTSAYPVYI